MKTLPELLKDAVAGMASPTFEEVAKAAQTLLAKQVKQSWAEKQDPDEAAWVGLKGKSFAGHSRRYPGKVWPRAILDMAMGADIKEGVTSKDGFETRGTLPYYWSWQNDGTKNNTGWGGPIPAREAWGFGQDLLDLCNSLLADKGAQVIVGDKTRLAVEK